MGGGEVPLPGLYLPGDAVDKVVYPLIRVQLPALLGEVADTHRLAPVDGAAVRGELPGKEVQQGGLSRPVAPHDAHPVLPAHPVGEGLENHPVPKGLGDPMQLHRLPSQAAGESGHLHRPVGLRAGLGLEGLVPGNAVLVLGPPGLGSPHDPLVLHPEDGLPLALGGLLPLLLLGFDGQVFGVIGLIVADVAVGELRDPVAHPL